MRKVLPIFFLVLGALSINAKFVKADTGTGATFTVTKTAAPDTVSPSAIVNFTVSITNNSTANAAPTEVTDTLPDGFQFANDAQLTDLSGNQAPFVPTIAGQVLTWTFDGTTLQSIPQNENIVISYSATASATPGNYKNRACLTQPESVCVEANITVQSSTPQAGVLENIAIVGGIGGALTVYGISRSKKKLSFEEKIIRSL